jgi:hypothetical protein
MLDGGRDDYVQRPKAEGSSTPPSSLTRLPVLDEAPKVKLHKMPRRLPRPIGDDELHDRLDVAKPWTREAAELARLFGLRLTDEN